MLDMEKLGTCIDHSLLWLSVLTAVGIRFERRFRIYDISDYGETIQTYKRLANDQIIDRMVLAGRGAPDLNVS